MTRTEPVVIREELDYGIEELCKTVHHRELTFTQEQKQIGDTVMKAVDKNKPLTKFIDVTPRWMTRCARSVRVAPTWGRRSPARSAPAGSTSTVLG